MAQSLEPRCACGGPWVPYSPHPKQVAFLNVNDREALFGGAAGGGKTDALLMAALQYVCVPGYAALLLRETFPQLSMEEGLIPRSQLWLSQTGAEWSAAHNRWTFPSGSTLTFGYIDRDDTRYKFAGGAWQFIGWDELVNWRTDVSYTFLFSRLRRPKPSDALRQCPSCGLTVADVPLRVRAGTNPGSRGAEWVYDRFIDPWRKWKAGEAERPARVFIPSRIDDNPSLDREEYLASLGELDSVTRAQLLSGDWDVRASGGMLKREYFQIVRDFPHDAQLCRFWDLAATAAAKGKNPDWTVGALVGLHEGRWYLVDVQRTRANPHGVEKLVQRTAAEDREKYGRIRTRMEQEPGSSGKHTIDHYARRILIGQDFKGVRSTGKKEERARVLLAAAESENFFMLRADWNGAFLDEAVQFPLGAHDDQVDAVSGAMDVLSHKRRVRLVV